MEVPEHEFEEAEKRMATLREAGHAVSARYDRNTSRVVVMLNTGVQLAFPTSLAEGLAGAPAERLADIEISPAGLGLHWPKVDLLRFSGEALAHLPAYFRIESGW